MVFSPGEWTNITCAGPRRVEHVPAPLDMSEVLRYLGYPAGAQPAARLCSLVDEWSREACLRAMPRATYLVLPIEQLRPRSLRVRTPTGEVVEFIGAIGEFLGAAKYVTAFIATAGPDVERLASELMQRGDPLAAMIVNAVGAERAEAAEAEVIEQLQPIAASCGLAPTLPYSPGYCGMTLTEQRKLFQLFQGCDVGVMLTDSCLMRPIKSVSGLIGWGAADRILSQGCPCDRCELYSCAMRR
jgi:hypothetical protein